MRSRFLSKTRTLIAVFDKVHRKGVSLISETDHPDASDDEFDDSLPLACRAGWLNRGSLHHGISPSLWTNTATGELFRRDPFTFDAPDDAVADCLVDVPPILDRAPQHWLIHSVFEVADDVGDQPVACGVILTLRAGETRVVSDRCRAWS